MSSWTPTDWTIFFTAVGGFLTVAVVPGIVAIIIAWRGSTKATEAKATADAGQQSTNRIADGLHAANQSIITTNQKIADVARDVVPAALQQRVDLMQASIDARKPDQT